MLFLLFHPQEWIDMVGYVAKDTVNGRGLLRHLVILLIILRKF